MQCELFSYTLLVPPLKIGIRQLELSEADVYHNLVLCLQVLIRMPQGERKERRFSSTDIVQTVYDYVDSLGILKVTEYKLVSNYPYTLYGPDTLQKSLRDAGMHPHASLFVKVEEE